MPQRVLMVHRYFWPDVPTYAQMLRFIGARLQAEGNKVSVFSGQPTYNGAYAGPACPRIETVDGIQVYRVGLPPDHKSRPVLRALSMLAFAGRLVAHVLRRRSEYDLLTITTIPPVVMGITARVIKRLTGIPYLYHCMDLYPEVATLAGMARSRWLVRVATRLDSANCRVAKVVVVLSSDMRTTLADRGLDCDNVVVLNNFEVLDSHPDRAAAVISKVSGTFRVLFAGNMGRFQALENLITVAQRLASELPELEFVLMGAGASVPALKQQAGPLLGKSVKFVDHQSVEVAARAMRESDLGLISLRPGIYKVAYPSKTAMYLTAGCRVLAAVEASSDLAQLVVAEDLGITCAPNDVDTMTEVIRREAAAGPLSPGRRAQVRAAGERHFGRAAKLDEWADLVARIGAQVVQ